MWKRASDDVKSSSKDLRNVWILGKALWKRYVPRNRRAWCDRLVARRDFGAFFLALTEHSWPHAIERLVVYTSGLQFRSSCLAYPENE